MKDERKNVETSPPAPTAGIRSRRNLLNHKRGSIAHSLSLSPTHRPDMTETLLKKGRKIASHPFKPIVIRQRLIKFRAWAGFSTPSFTKSAESKI